MEEEDYKSKGPTKILLQPCQPGRLVTLLVDFWRDFGSALVELTPILQRGKTETLKHQSKATLRDGGGLA